ncbi:hypothetical protein Thiowin_04350 [Thiorhodovibrio winogradskyi]|uniref:Uncharacterized protein n=1 Tax=Thiorhodovibrio winogradskyi TaxID=77007 RepID=A0ABZ0SDY6_9GAMM
MNHAAPSGGRSAEWRPVYKAIKCGSHCNLLIRRSGTDDEDGHSFLH